MAGAPGALVAGRYRQLCVVGSGGMGVVWRAHDEYLDRSVALKEVRLAPGLGAEGRERALRRTLREARAAAGLKHQGIVTIYDVVSDDGRPWIVMELVEGRSLAQVLHEVHALPVRSVAEIGLSVVRALKVAHQRGIVHRDVKPGNILLDGDRVVLTDFGIAVIEGGTALTAKNELIGSVEYMAPERITGAGASAASDLWSVGVTLYTAVEGRSPFEHPNAEAVIGAILTHTPTAPRRAGALWPVIDRLLAKDPARRPTIEKTERLLAAVLSPPVVREAPPRPPVPPASLPPRLPPPMAPPMVPPSPPADSSGKEFAYLVLFLLVGILLAVAVVLSQQY